MSSPQQITTVVATRNRWHRLRESLARHTGPVILVDNGSTDGTVAKVREHFPGIRVLPLPANRGATARNIGVAETRTPYVAFADDDSWWAPGALAEAVELFHHHPRMALLAGRILVGPEQRLDATCRLMADSPLGTEADLPGPSVLGFLACGAVLRRDAFLQAGGFDEVVFFFGEEERLALDLAAAGWGLAYVEHIVAHHHPQPAADGRAGRAALASRNRLLTAVLRRPWPQVSRILLSELGNSSGRRGAAAALPRLPGALRRRRQLPAEIEAARRALDRVSF
ncbi:MAG: glycosyltransferase family 2 protein [Jatrophihabitantaceae bacterium]